MKIFEYIDYPTPIRRKFLSIFSTDVVAVMKQR